MAEGPGIDVTLCQDRAVKRGLCQKHYDICYHPPKHKNITGLADLQVLPWGKVSRNQRW